MSSTAVDAGPRRGRSITIAVPAVGAAAAVGVGLTALLVFAAFVGKGGLQLEPTTDVLIVLMLVGGGLSIAAVVRAPRDAESPLRGAAVLIAFLLLAVYTALSIIWSLAPSDSWMEANRTIAYLATLAGAVALARLVPSAWTGLLGGLAAGCLIISAWALLTKVFPGALAADETFARLRAPFDYWNSVGLMAALGVPVFLWLATRREGNRFVGAIAWPAIALLMVCVMFSYSRGALLAIGIGLLFWLGAVPLRRASLVPLGACAIVVAPLVVWAFQQDGLTTDEAPLAARIDAGHEFGAILLLACVVLLAAGLANQFERWRHPAGPSRPLPGRVALAGVVIVALGLSIAAAADPGKVSDSWTRLTDPQVAAPSNSPGRFTATSSVRARYWREAFLLEKLSPWVGTGAGSFAVARTRARIDAREVRHAHGYVPQTLSDLGWVGMAISILVLLAAAVAMMRVTGMLPRDRGLPFDGERIGMFALMTVVIIFVAHSALDWTWFVPANAVAALVALGWMAGRPSLRSRLLAPAPAVVEEEAPAPSGHWSRRPVDYARRSPGSTIAVVLLAAMTVVAAWTAYQPVRSAHASEEAFARVEQGAFEPAAAIAQVAVDRNPLSVDARFDQATIEQARGQLATAEDDLIAAVKLEPSNAETWRRLGRFRLDALQKPRDALRAFQAAYVLDPHSDVSRSDVLEATHAIQAGG